MDDEHTGGDLEEEQKNMEHNYEEIDRRICGDLCKYSITFDFAVEKLARLDELFPTQTLDD